MMSGEQKDEAEIDKKYFQQTICDVQLLSKIMQRTLKIQHQGY